MRAPITLDLHLPNFNYPGTGPEDEFEKIIEICTTAERSGFSSVSLMDHLYQIGPVGPPENWMFEGSTMLAAIAARTEKLTLGLLVGSVTYRNPALAAKVTTTLDIISGGRAWHGIGAGWFEEEHIGYGYEFPPLKVRFEMLEEHLQIVRSMFTEPRTSFEGKHFKTHQAFNNPKPLRGDIPIMVGGSGERKTLRLVAQYADACNVFGNAERAKHLLGVLEGHCETVGRDPDEITKTAMSPILIGNTHEEAERKLDAARQAGLPEERIAMLTAGDADEIGEWAQGIAGAGIEGLAISLPDVHDLETLELTGKTLSAVFSAPVA